MTRKAMLCVVLIGVLGMAQQDPGPTETPTPTTQPATEDSQTARPLRKPFQDDILKTLLNRKEQPSMIPQRDPDADLTPNPPGESKAPRNPLLMLEGTPIVERPAEYKLTGDQPSLSLRLAGERRIVTMEVLPSSLLEALEQQVERGATEFIVSGEVTTYHGRNYLFLHKVIRRIDNGNLAP